MEFRVTKSYHAEGKEVDCYVESCCFHALVIHGSFNLLVFVNIGAHLWDYSQTGIPVWLILDGHWFRLNCSHIHEPILRFSVTFCWNFSCACESSY